MEVFSGFSQVIESNGSPMRVATALALINDKLQGILWDQEAEFDLETRAAVAWYDQYDWEMGDSGRAEQVAMGKNTSIPRLVHADIMWAKAGDARLLRADEMPVVELDGLFTHPTVWSTALRVSELLENGHRADAVKLLASVRDRVQLDAIVDLARLMFTLGEKRKRTDDQLRFNNLVTEWPELAKNAREYAAEHGTVQPTLDEVS
jgi:putative DNA methylase